VPAAESLRGDLRAMVERQNSMSRAFWLDRISELAARVVLSNPVEASMLEHIRFDVIPNGCDIPSSVPRRTRTSIPTLLFVGLMRYEPNADAAAFLVREIVPELRSQIGDEFEIRIVGTALPNVAGLARERNVVVTGYVEDLEVELARA